MSELEVSLYCALCSERHEQKIPMPDGWDSRYRSVSDEKALCPKHSEIAAFADSQCPGCVGSWGDCPLFQAFAYRDLLLTDDDFGVLSQGICPKRVNGSMSVTVTAKGSTIEELDLRGSPEAKAGQALATAIKEYAIKYHRSQP